MRIASKIKVAVLTILLVYPVTSGAQTVTSADAKAFMGTWVINVDAGGPISVDLTVKEVAGEVTAEIGGGSTGGPMSAVSEITKNGSSLVMQYEAEVPQAGLTSITLTVEADGDTLTASFDVAGQVLPGTGTRK